METMEVLWSEHVNFGTSRSHKKQMGKKRGEGTEWKNALDAKMQMAKKSKQPEQVESLHSKSSKREKKEQSSFLPGSLAAKAAASSSVNQQKRALPNTGRFSGTLAAKLLSTT